MSQLRFHHVFFVLMALSALAAFALPARVANHMPQVAALFSPISRPSGALAAWLHGRIAPDPVSDTRSTAAIRTENEELKATVESLSVQLEELRARDAELGKLGKLRDLCTPFAVVGPDSGPRESLLLRGSTLEGLREGMAVIYPGGVVGSVNRAGVAGAQVQLITDVGFRVRASIGSFRRGKDDSIQFARLDLHAALFEGIGSNLMQAQNLTLDDVNKAGVKPGNVVILTDADWSQPMQGEPLGKIVSITPREHAPGFVSVRVQPQTNLMRLREVMVLTKDK